MEPDGIQRYYNLVAEQYDNLYTDPISLAENKWIQKRFVETLKGFSAPLSILDLGCGTGLGYQFLADQEGLDQGYIYHGIDVSSEMILQAKRKWQTARNASFEVGDMSDLSRFKDKSFHVVTSFFGSFSHALQSDRTLDDIARVLLPGGKLFLMTYSRYSFRALSNYLFSKKDNELDLFKEYNIRNNGKDIACSAKFYCTSHLRYILEERGFKNIRFMSVNMLLEENAIKRFLQKYPKACSRWLRLEQVVLRYFPDLGHSLVTIAEKAR